LDLDLANLAHGAGLWMLNAVVCTQGSLMKILKITKTGKYAKKD